MKNKKITLALFVLGFGLLSCDQEHEDQLLTQQISKIETSYVEGTQIRQESMYGSMSETKAPDWYLKKILQDEIDAQISDVMTSRARGRTARYTDYDLGFIVGAAGWNTCPVENRVSFYMDTEDYRPATTATALSGDNNYPWYIETTNTHYKAYRNITMTFCRFDATNYLNMRYAKNHAVLKLGSLNLPGTTLIGRRFDNEDNGNNSLASGDVYPNYVNGNTKLYFTYFEVRTAPATPSTLMPSGYGVLASPDASAGNSFHYFIDDENSNNANYWTLNGRQQSSWTGCPFMGGGVNTSFYLLMYY